MGESNSFWDILNPVDIIAEKTGAGWFKDMNFTNTMAVQSLQNTMNVAQGKESFGTHENWAGSGKFGDFLNPIMGGKTDVQREATADNDQLWRDYYNNMIDTAPKKEKKEPVSGFKPKPGVAPKSGITGTSLLTEET